jgi:hypothetical protein
MYSIHTHNNLKIVEKLRTVIAIKYELKSMKKIQIKKEQCLVVVAVLVRRVLAH